MTLVEEENKLKEEVEKIVQFGLMNDSSKGVYQWEIQPLKKQLANKYVCSPCVCVCRPGPCDFGRLTTKVKGLSVGDTAAHKAAGQQVCDLKYIS